MISRVYLPSAYVDEVCPPLRPSPSDWLIRGADGWHLVADSSYTDRDTTDRPGDALTHGQVVAFEWREDHPSRTVTVRISENGDVSHDPVGFIPAGINMFWLDDDIDTLMDHLDYLLENEVQSYLEDGQGVKLSMAEWGKASFHLVENGEMARFVAVHEAPRAAPAQESLPGMSS